MTAQTDCQTCANRGHVAGLSQETYCEQCVRGTPWLSDHYRPNVPPSQTPAGTMAQINTNADAGGRRGVKHEVDHIDHI